jgi:hypothetical protein
VQLPSNFRETLVEQLDGVISAYDEGVDPEVVATFVLEFTETFGEDEGIDNIIEDLETAGNIGGNLLDALESEYESSDMEVTAEEAVSLLERLCGIDWEDTQDDPTEESLDDNTEELSMF